MVMLQSIEDIIVGALTMFLGKRNIMVSYVWQK